LALFGLGFDHEMSWQNMLQSHSWRYCQVSKAENDVDLNRTSVVQLDRGWDDYLEYNDKSLAHAVASLLFHASDWSEAYRQHRRSYKYTKSSKYAVRL